MVSVRTLTATWAAPLSGVDWLMVTTLPPAALMPASSACSAPVSSSRVASTVMTLRLLRASNTQSLYL